MTDPRTALPYVVEFRSLFSADWKLIAAFNYEHVAEAYRDQCRAKATSLEYRMRDLTP